MKDTGATLRSVYSSLLGAISYGGKSVPFYAEEPMNTVPDNYIVLTSIDSIDQSNDARFVHDITVTLDIVTKMNMKNSREAADSISNSVLNALFPTPYVDRETADFQVMIRQSTSPGYIRDVDGSANRIRKILRITNHLIQK